MEIRQNVAFDVSTYRRGVLVGKLHLQTPETMKLFASTIKLRDKSKNEENVPSLEVI